MGGGGGGAAGGRGRMNFSIVICAGRYLVNKQVTQPEASTPGSGKS